ncbi:MAG: YolD-like family protein [Bacillota bacterium]|nr:YolD-like family protein [Bacillota bacterium]
MFLKKLTQNSPITIDYYKNGDIKTCKGLVYRLDLNEQILSLKDEKQKAISIRLSGIKQIY